MQEADLNKLKQFESILKKCLQDRFGKVLPQDKISLLNNTEYVDEEELKGLTNRDEIQGKILRKMLGSIINISTTKEFQINETEKVALDYGEDLDRGIIEYYANEISKKYSFNIDEIPGLKDNLELVILIKERLDNGLDSHVFDSDALKLLSLEGLEDAASRADRKALDKYLEKNAKAAALSKNTDQKEKQGVIEEYVSRKGSIQIVTIDKKEYIKYIDESKEVHLVEVNDLESVVDFYKKKIAELNSGEELDPERFFAQLKEIASEEQLTKTEDLDKDELSSNQIDMISFIKSNSHFKPAKDQAPVRHNEEANIHVIENTNDLVITKANLNSETNINSIDAEIIKDGTGEGNGEIIHEDVISEAAVLSPEQYEEICMKYARNEELTPEEYNALLRSTPGLMTEEELENYKAQLNQQNQNASGPTLSMYGKKKQYSYGFGSKNMIIYMTFITVIIGLIFGALLFTLTS